MAYRAATGGRDINTLIVYTERHAREESILLLGAFPETGLRDAILKAGLPDPECQKGIPLSKPFTQTTPDFFCEDPKSAGADLEFR